MLRATLASFGRVFPIAALSVGLVGLFRLGHQFPSASSSPGLLVPFLFPVLALSLEAGALVAVSSSSLGLLLQLSPRPWAARARALAPLLVLLSLVLWAAALVPRGTDRPGALANELVARARQSCTKASSPVVVPLLGLSVTCADGPVRVEGPMPGVRAVKVAMGELSFSDDLRRVQISRLDLTAKRALTVRLRAGSARISGLAPWTRSSRLSRWARWGIIAGIGAGLTLLASWLWPTAAPAPATASGARDPSVVNGAKPWLAWASLALCAVPGAVAAAVLIGLDQESAAPRSYAAAAVAALLALLALRLLVARVPKILSSFRAF
jgi:hypothetical protein